MSAVRKQDNTEWLLSKGGSEKARKMALEQEPSTRRRRAPAEGLGKEQQGLKPCNGKGSLTGSENWKKVSEITAQGAREGQAWQTRDERGKGGGRVRWHSQSY